MTEEPAKTEITVTSSFTVPTKIEYSAELEDTSSTVYQEKSSEVMDFFRPSLEAVASESGTTLSDILVVFSQSSGARRRRRQATDGVQVASAAAAEVTGVYTQQVADELEAVDTTTLTTAIKASVEEKIPATISAAGDEDELFSSQVVATYGETTAEKEEIIEATETPPIGGASAVTASATFFALLFTLLVV